MLKIKFIEIYVNTNSCELLHTNDAWHSNNIPCWQFGRLEEIHNEPHHWISPLRILGWLGGSGSFGYFEVMGRKYPKLPEPPNQLSTLPLTSKYPKFPEPPKQLSILTGEIHSEKFQIRINNFNFTDDAFINE